MLTAFMPSRLWCRFNLKLSTLLAFVALVFIIAAMLGCAHTPQQQYDGANFSFKLANRLAGVVEQDPKMSDVTRRQINDGLVLVQNDLVVAKKWLADNPTLANTVGVALPPLDPINVALGILFVELRGVQAVPDTQP